MLQDTQVLGVQRKDNGNMNLHLMQGLVQIVTFRIMI